MGWWVRGKKETPFSCATAVLLVGKGKSWYLGMATSSLVFLDEEAAFF